MPTISFIAVLALVAGNIYQAYQRYRWAITYAKVSEVNEKLVARIVLLEGENDFMEQIAIKARAALANQICNQVNTAWQKRRDEDEARQAEGKLRKGDGV
jgi:hypothetical protein